MRLRFRIFVTVVSFDTGKSDCGRSPQGGFHIALKPHARSPANARCGRVTTEASSPETCRFGSRYGSSSTNIDIRGHIHPKLGMLNRKPADSSQKIVDPAVVNSTAQSLRCVILAATRLKIAPEARRHAMMLVAGWVPMWHRERQLRRRAKEQVARTRVLTPSLRRMSKRIEAWRLVNLLSGTGRRVRIVMKLEQHSDFVYRHSPAVLQLLLLAILSFVSVRGSSAQAVSGELDLADSEAKDTTQATMSPSEPPAPYVFKSLGTRVVVPQADYRAGPLKRRFLGTEYRALWTTPLEFPIIDLSKTAGGLTPLERGGGLQTTTLHLVGEDGHFYVLRSVDKSADLSLPEGFRGTIIASITQDQISAMNPVGAVIIPPLARAAGVLHTAPTLVIIPDSPELGEFREDYAGMLALFERKPDEDQSNEPRFGYAKNIVGSANFFGEIEDDNDNVVDERAYARVRLFDMLIGDWDRHDDQWRWAEFETEHGTRFVAVPRDRDFAFVKFDGMLNRLGRNIGDMNLRRLVDFNEKIDDVLGLNWQGSKLDRRITSRLTRDDWTAIADSIKDALTDELIEEAVRVWPDAVYSQMGPRTIRNLKGRRDDLPRVASEYYELLAETVDIVGTNKHERFEVTRLNSNETRVVVRKTKKEGDIVRTLYDRTFLHDETNEIRLYGLGGNDQFIVEGEVDGGVLVRMIGGEGSDRFEDRSSVAGIPRKTRVYDTVDDTETDLGGEALAEISRDPRVNTYEMSRFELHSTIPVAALDYNSDDGIFVGGGLRFIRSGFRKDPYAAQHQFTLTYAPRSSAYNVRYAGELTRVWKRFDALIDAQALAAREFRNYYGLGNETPESNRDLFRAELQTVSAAPLLRRSLGGRSYVEFGPRGSYVSVDPAAGLRPDNPAVGFPAEELIDKYFLGFGSAIALDSRDSTLNPRRGLYWTAESEFNTAVRTASDRFARFASELRLYYSPPIPSQITLALRAGGATNVGTFSFFQANTIGVSDNLRGYRSSRFAGRSSAFGNAELRAKLFDFNIYLTRGEIGAFGFFDTGRVWVDDENSDVWHQGYGGGLWVTPFNLILLTGSMGFSEEGRVFDLSIGFQY